ncbi:MAG: tagaturonate reductase [Chitinophagaceae bacterium]|nr:tagaturonate reductase [Chitinophagaceae bacterium]
MQLSREIISSIDPAAAGLFALPERVLQFGTGVLLRGLPDYFIDKANRRGSFNGRIVVVKSTATGGTDAFKQQDGLYTLVERGMENGVASERITVNASVSRVLSASEEWDQILACAENPLLQLIISNTTEVGIAFLEADAKAVRPVSFPGRVLSLLYRRYRHFNGSADSGMVIIPTELIVDNGDRLRDIVLQLARLGDYDSAFIQWLGTANEFCNSLVDRIVPGRLSRAEQEIIEKRLGYSDELMIMAETYRLWAIETTSERTKTILSFSQADSGVLLAGDIGKYRELKLRLLNGTHTLCCGLAYLAGFRTVKEAMNEPLFAEYVSGLMMQEIASLVAQEDISLEEARHFASQVIDRFSNPYIEHQWLSICVQYSSKMLMRAIPLIEKHYAAGNDTPELMALGFAAYLLFSKPAEQQGDHFYGSYKGQRYPIQDDKAALLYACWQNYPADTALEKIMGSRELFGLDLTAFKGFAKAVRLYLAALEEQGVMKTFASGITKKSVA